MHQARQGQCTLAVTMCVIAQMQQIVLVVAAAAAAGMQPANAARGLKVGQTRCW